MKTLRYFLIRFFLRKPLLIGMIFILVFAASYIAFNVTRTFVSTFEGVQEVENLNAPGTVIMNLDPDVTVDIEKVSEQSVRDVYDHIVNSYDFGLFTDGYIAEIENTHDIEVPVAYMNNRYDELNGFDVISGIGINYEYSLSAENTIPVLIGQGLSNDYPLNSRIKIIDPALNREVTYEVKGVLGQDPAHSNLYALDSKQYYNFSVIVPVTEQFIELAETTFKINGLMDLVLIGVSPDEAQQLGEYIKDRTALKFNFFSQQENLDFYNEYYQSSMIFLIVISAVLLIGIIFLAIWSSLAGVRVMIREFTINILVGLSYKRIRNILLVYYSLISLLILSALVIMVISSRQAAWSRKDASFMTYGTFGGLMQMDLIGLGVTVMVNFLLVLLIVKFIVWQIRKVPVSLGVLQ